MQISYHKAFDINHTIFRFLRVADLARGGASMHQDLLFISDFYMTFPIAIKDFRVKRVDIKAKNELVRRYTQNRFNTLPDGRLMLARMRPLHSAALEALSAAGIISEGPLKEYRVEFLPSEIPHGLAQRAFEANSRDQALSDFIKGILTGYSLSGVDGLRDRSGLMEHRYDAV